MEKTHNERLSALFTELLETEGNDALRSVASLAVAEFAERRNLEQQSFEAKVVRVVDGDTIQVSAGDGTRRVRLLGLDAPEDGQPGEEGATEFVTEQALGKVVHVRGLTTDRYERLVAVVGFPDGRILNHQIVREGWAWHYDYFAPNEDVLRDLEMVARARRSGLWGLSEEAVQPWQWRQRNGKRRVS